MALRSAVAPSVGDEGVVGLATAGAIRSGRCRRAAEGGYPRFLCAALAATPVSVLLDRAGIFFSEHNRKSRGYGRGRCEEDRRAKGAGQGDAAIDALGAYKSRSKAW